MDRTGFARGGRSRSVGMERHATLPFSVGVGYSRSGNRNVASIQRAVFRPGCLHAGCWGNRTDTGCTGPPVAAISPQSTAARHDPYRNHLKFGSKLVEIIL